MYLEELNTFRENNGEVVIVAVGGHATVSLYD